jgi:DNA repair photolyase
MPAKYEKKDFKSIINKMKFIDNWFWGRYTLNPYNGCEHACTYCDSRSHKYHLHPEFDQVIIVKNNVGEMLDKRLTRARTLQPDVVSMSGSCDPYQPAEEEFGNTRECLEVLAKHKYPVQIGTKASIVTRDIPLFEQIAENNWCSVGITITSTDEGLSTFLEPGAPSPTKRFEAIKKLKDSKKIQVGVHFMPIVPFLEDTDENLEQVIRSSKNAGADYILYAGGMTMRDNQAKWFLQKLKDAYPELVDKYLELYDAKIVDGEYKGRYAPKSSYSKKIHKKLFELCEKYGIAPRMKRFIPEDFRKENYLIAEELLNEAYMNQSLGKKFSNQFWAGMNINNIKESIRSVAARGELKKIRNVDEQLEQRIINTLRNLN